MRAVLGSSGREPAGACRELRPQCPPVGELVQCADAPEPCAFGSRPADAVAFNGSSHRRLPGVIPACGFSDSWIAGTVNATIENLRRTVPAIEAGRTATAAPVNVCRQRRARDRAVS